MAFCETSPYIVPSTYKPLPSLSVIFPRTLIASLPAPFAAILVLTVMTLSSSLVNVEETLIAEFYA